MVAVTGDLVLIPVLEMHHRSGCLPAVYHGFAGALLFVDIAPVIILAHVGLIAAAHPFGQRLAPKLNAAIVIAQLALGPENKVTERLFGNQEFVVRKPGFLGRAHDDSVANGPKPW